MGHLRPTPDAVLAPTHTALVGAFSDENSECFAHAAERAGCEMDSYRTVGEAKEGLMKAVPRAIFISCKEDIKQFVGWVRCQAALYTVPVIVVVPNVSEHAFHTALRVGADDAIVRHDGGGVTRRLAHLSHFDPGLRPEINQGRCIIASPGEARRKVLGRLARQAGFDVSFAFDALELETSGRDASLIVADADEPGVASLGWMRETRDVPTVLLADEAFVPGLRARVQNFRCSVDASDAPPDHLLFMANELMRPDVANVRASQRVLHATICGFRKAGSLEPVFGLSYNLSREGLYVRTLDPPERNDDIWLEVRLPLQREAVHVRGKVVWATGPSKPGGVTPPGFGLKIQAADSPPGDLAAYHAAYEELIDSRVLRDAAA